MQTISISKAKARFSKLVDKAAKGEPLIITKAGKPIVKIIPYTTSTRGKVQRLGFMAGQIMVPDDFDSMGNSEIEQLFNITA